jgi:excisionase family DNA binding protein
MVDPINLTVNQFCSAVPCGRTKAYELIADGEIEAIKLGTRTLIPRGELERLQARLPRMRTHPAGPPNPEILDASSTQLEALGTPAILPPRPLEPPTARSSGELETQANGYGEKCDTVLRRQ